MHCKLQTKVLNRHVLDNLALQKGLEYITNGHVTYKAVADAQGLEYVSAETLLNK